MNEKKIIDYIFTVGNSKRKVDNFKEFLREIGNPHLDFKSIQIIGTNGKGSTAMFLKSLLRQANKTVATFTSPTVKVVYDRIQIDSVNISSEEFCKIFNEIECKIKKYQLGFFEILTAIAFKYFSKSKIDYAIIEAGIGGLNDCTSFVDCDVRLLTTVSYDHMDLLGYTIEEICFQKLGALNPCEHLITTANNAHKFIADYCSNKSITYEFVKKPVNYNVSLLGEYQKMNASLALRCISHLDIELSEKQIIMALKSVKWPGRMQLIRENVLVDGAHNVEGILACTNFCNKHFGKNNYTIVFSCLKDKEIESMINYLKMSSNKIIFTTFDFYRAYNRSELENLSIDTELDYKKLVDNAFNSNENYLFVGSLYFIYDILHYVSRCYNVNF